MYVKSTLKNWENKKCSEKMKGGAMMGENSSTEREIWKVVVKPKSCHQFTNLVIKFQIL